MSQNIQDTLEPQSFASRLAMPGFEMLWTAAIALVVLTGSYAMLPSFIRMMGKSGRIESVEWSVFILLGIGFPIIAALAAWVGSRVSRRVSGVATKAALVVVAFYCAVFFWKLGIGALTVSLVCAALVVGVAMRARVETTTTLEWPWHVVALLLLTAVWESVFRTASWTDAQSWMTHSFRTPIITIGVTVLITIAIAFGRTRHDDEDRRFRFSWIDVIPFAAFVVLSFRTTPIVEFYHWSFWVGPIESVRQGGWLLWDVPSQYGFLSILLPSLLPTHNAWQALYIFQAALYVVTAIAIYLSIASLGRGMMSRSAAFLFTVTALFFRPRTASLILSAQMTPAGGPMRFFWCYAILAVVGWKYRQGEKVSDLRFSIIGNIVWLASIAWSAESAIYTTVAWGGAFCVFLMQRYFATRSARGAATGLSIPAVVVAAGIAALTAIYLVLDGHSPDWMNYYEYALLFSGGYSSLPVETLGAFWYLLVLFILVSAAVVHFISRGASRPELFVAVGAWGTVWGISSYFVSRSHPVNLLSLVPLLVFSLVIVLHLLKRESTDGWTRLVSMASVPLIAMPIVLTLSHDGFPSLLLRRQDGLAKLTAQVPAMDSSLATLARSAGIKPEDAVYFVSDGRYVMPRWPELVNGEAMTNDIAWLPKPYEMISTLSPARRDLYIQRFQSRVKVRGWLIQKKSEINPAYNDVLRVLLQTGAPGEIFQNSQWIISKWVRIAG